MVYVVIGVAGSGKTTVGKLLAEKLRLPFHDADDEHPPENVAKMTRGIPLTDDDRMPWLALLAGKITEWNAGAGAVLACSALKEQYRHILCGSDPGKVAFIHLYGTPDLIQSRLEGRAHYFPPTLLESQFEALQVPEDAISVEVNAAPDDICLKILQELAARDLL